jgi:hypothetical protein
MNAKVLPTPSSAKNRSGSSCSTWAGLSFAIVVGLSIVSIAFRILADLPMIAAPLFLIATCAISIRAVTGLFIVQHGAQALYQLGPAAKVVNLAAHNPLDRPEPGPAIEVIVFSNSLCM